MANKSRKCAHCGQDINVANKEDLGHILKYKNKYYHTSCFIKLAKSRVANNNRYSASWQEALDNIDTLIADAQISITTKVNIKTDALNSYLLLCYDVGGGFSSRFWSTIMDIGNGIYKRRRCQPIDCDTLLDMWKYYQKDLDKTYIYNKTRGKDMEGESRANYDLAILMGKYGAYKKAKAQEEAAEIERQMQSQKDVQINYDKIKIVNSTDGLEDISALLDDII